MTDTPLSSYLTVPEKASVDELEKAFAEYARERVQGAAEKYDADTVAGEQRALRDAFAAFFATIRAALPDTPPSKKAPEAAAGLKDTARVLMADVENGTAELASCYMHINRYMTLVHDSIRSEERFLNISGKKIEWTSDLDFTIRRSKKRRREIEEENVRLAHAYLVLEGASRHYRALDEALGQVAAEADKDKLLRSLNSALRTKNSAKRTKALHAIKSYKRKFSLAGKATQAQKEAATEAAKRFTAVITGHAAELENNDGRLYLHPVEIRNALTANDQEVEKIRQYLAKYQMPYMRGKLDGLARLKDKLLLVGTLDKLIALHVRLARGLADPLDDLATLRDLESHGTEAARYLVQHRFPEIAVIRDHSDKLVAEFRNDLKEFKSAGEKREDKSREPAPAETET